jgi:hypothetical protein
MQYIQIEYAHTRTLLMLNNYFILGLRQTNKHDNIETVIDRGLIFLGDRVRYVALSHNLRSETDLHSETSYSLVIYNYRDGQVHKTIESEAEIVS